MTEDSVDYVWINGGLVEKKEAKISVFDHGLVTGDGVFETIGVYQGAPFTLTRHLERLEWSAEGIGLPSLDIAAIRVGVAAHPEGLGPSYRFINSHLAALIAVIASLERY